MTTAANGSDLVVDVFTDPSCPWTWIISRWLKEAAPQRNLELRWRSYSLEIRDAGDLPAPMPEDVRRGVRQWAAESHRAPRVFEALRADGGVPLTTSTGQGWMSLPETPAGSHFWRNTGQDGSVYQQSDLATRPQPLSRAAAGANRRFLHGGAP